MTTSEIKKLLSFDDTYAWALIAVMSAAIVSLFLSLQAGVFLLLFAALAWWSWQNPEESFLLLIVSAPILPMLKITETIGTATLMKDVIILVLFVKGFAWPLLQKRLPYRRNVLVFPLLALVSWSVFATLQADSIILGVLRLRDIGLYMLLYMGVLYLNHDSKTMKTRFVYFTATFAIVLLLGIWQWFFAQDSAVLRFDPVRSIWIPRLSSVMAHPSIYGQFLVAAAGLFASVAFFSIKQTAKSRAVSIFFFFASIPFIYLTYSRAVWMGFATAMAAIGVVYLWQSVTKKIGKKKIMKIFSTASVAAAGMVLLLLQFTAAGGFLRSIVDPTYGSNEERIIFFTRLLSPMSYSEAIIGAGLGNVTAQNFREVDLEVFDIASGSARAVQMTKNKTLVDNQYLKTFVEMGVVGLVLYGWIYWRLFAAAWQNIFPGLTHLPMKSPAKPELYHRLRPGGFVQFLRYRLHWLPQRTLRTPRSPARRRLELGQIRKPCSRCTGMVISVWQIAFLAAFIVQAFFIDIWEIFPTNLLFWITAAFVSQMNGEGVLRKREI